MWIKICANTNLEDALAAAELGADAVGFVFAASRRQVSAAQVAAITPHLPRSVERVGVFVGDDIDEIARTVDQAGLTTVQMHSGVNLELADRLQTRLGSDISIIETAHWNVADDEESERTSEFEVRTQLAALASDPHSFRVLIDAKAGPVSGGLGVAYKWSKARPVLRSQADLRVIVAGGLQVETVAQAIRELEPWGIDVASGVEIEPGKKDYRRMRMFIQSARSAQNLERG